MYQENLDVNIEESEEKSVIKRSGERVPFNTERIKKAISRENQEEGITGNRLNDAQINEIVSGISKDVYNDGRDFSVEEIQDKVENALMDSGKHEVARLYIKIPRKACRSEKVFRR